MHIFYISYVIFPRQMDQNSPSIRYNSGRGAGVAPPVKWVKEKNK